MSSMQLCRECTGYAHPDEPDDHEDCEICGDVHPEIEQHGENRYCDWCEEFVDHTEDAHDSDNDDVYYKYGEEPRSEEELLKWEPERVAGIHARINNLINLHDKKVADSPYYTRLFPKGTYYGQEHHQAVVYSKATNNRVGYLSYGNKGDVEGMFVDKEHTKSLATIQLLVTAHNHLKSLGNPIGLLHASNTTIDSGGLIKKIDPDSTYLTSNSAMASRQPYTENGHSVDSIPGNVEKALIRPVSEWNERAKQAGVPAPELMIQSYSWENRSNARMHPDWYKVSDEAKEIGKKIEKEHQRAIGEVQDTSRYSPNSLARRIIADRKNALLGDIPHFNYSEDLGFPKEELSGRPAFMEHDFNIPGPSQAEIKEKFGFDAEEAAASMYSEGRENLSDDQIHVTSALRWSSGLSQTLTELRQRPRGTNPSVRSTWMDSDYKKQQKAVQPTYDLIGTSGVWTGDDDLEDKKSPAKEVNLNLSPYERVRMRIKNHDVQYERE